MKQSKLYNIVSNMIDKLNEYRAGHITKNSLIENTTDILIVNKEDSNKSVSLMLRILNIPEGGIFNMNTDEISMIISNSNGEYHIDVISI